MRTAWVPWAVLGALLAGCGPASTDPDTGPAGPLLRGPFIGEVTTTSVVIAWSTDFSGLGEVDYGPGLDFGSVASESSSAESHAVRIEGLSPGSTYFYRVRTGGEVLASGRAFKTARPSTDPALRFVAFGDCGSGTAAQLAVAEQVRQAAPDLAILTGDIIYENGEARNFDPLYFEPYADLIDHIPFYTSLGNHDVRTQNGQPYLDAFHLPHNNPLGTERYYSFQAANARFIALDSNQDASPGSAMVEWLNDELAVPADWKFVFFHHSPFSSGPHGIEQEIQTLRAQLAPVLEAGGVDVVFSGHDHLYERTYPLQNGSPTNQSQEPDYVNPAGVIYMVTGGGGRPLYQKVTTNSFTASFESVHHLVLVDIAGQLLTLTAVRSDGSEVDSMTLNK